MKLDPAKTAWRAQRDAKIIELRAQSPTPTKAQIARIVGCGVGAVDKALYPSLRHKPRAETLTDGDTK